MEVVIHLLDKVEIWVSPEILNEYREVPIELKAEDKINHEQLKILIAGIASFVLEAKIAYPKKTISVCRDIEDNMILECCLTAKVDFLVTGDKDLLEIDPSALRETGLGRLGILRPRDFLDYLK